MDAERDALVALYRATNRNSWKIKTGWCTNAPLSGWDGVEVSDGRVVGLNLSWNNLEGSIPKEVGQLGALTTLDLRSNQLKGSIPKELGQLSALTELVLYGNQLEVMYYVDNIEGPLPPLAIPGSIPKELGQLGALTTLLLFDNNLEGSIPKELGQLGALTKLNLGSNQLKGSIPKELGQLGALTALDLYWNQLEVMYYVDNIEGPLPPLAIPGSIPKELGQLGALTTLDLAHNKLEELPHAIAVAFKKLSPDFRGNSWKEPPSDVVGQGMTAVIRYWQDAKIYGRRFSNRLKVVLVGLGSAGKTSLAIRLEGRDGGSLPGEEERTVGVEIRDINLKPSPVGHPQHSGQGLAVKLWDFAGQQAYYDTHQIFLTQGALYILVVDISTYRVEHTPEEAMEQWIDIIQSRVPGAVVLLVGTHRDAFKNADHCDKRKKELFRDVMYHVYRLRKECEARGRVALDGNGISLVRVVNAHDVFLLDCKSSGKDEINCLRSFIATVAYRRDYSFPSVESQIPTPWVYAFLTLEAIRRGADLRGVSGKITAVQNRLEQGDPRTAKCFVPSHHALALFKNLWRAMDIENARPLALLKNFWKAKSNKNAISMQSEEKATEVFFNAIALNEAQGWILLTNIDGNMNDKCGDDVNRSQLVLHVDPVRFADVVRRIVDIRLVDSASKPKVEEALRCFAKETGVHFYELSRQHHRFYKAGEVSKNYLKFLWLHRELDLGQATKEAPPLEMTEEDVGAMVGSLVDLRMMFPVRDDAGEFLRDRYIVGACLPDHVVSKVTPESILEIKVGSAMFRLVLKIHGSRNMPPGLIPRLLAWCGRGEGRITACWRHGGCFTYKKHLVLIYECRTSERQSSIVCCAKGDASTEKAGSVLDDVAEEVHRLIRDPRYGFPGIELFRNGSMEKEIVAQDNDLEELLQRLEKDLEDHMNLRFDELERRSERIANGVNAHLHAELGAFEGRLEERFDGIERKIDFAAALAGKCLLLSLKDGCPCPRLIWTEEDISSTAQPQPGRRFGHFRRMRWLKRMKTSSTRFRIRFLCAHDYSLVACGADGNGYILEHKDWQRWLQKCLPVLQLTLWVLRLGVSFIARADLLPMDDMLATLKEVVGEDVANKMEALDLRRASDGVGAMESNLDKQVEVYGKAYKDLVEFVEKEEEIMVKMTHVVGSTTTSEKPPSTASSIARNITSPGGQEHLARQSTVVSPVPTCKRSFEGDMVYVNRVASSTGEVEFAWVHKNNKKAWETAVG